mmetsp:Transcript_7693/g.10985  ORF Transcript_7693/g.10985 Transcript_7693/m.10985 type:complete len:236 (+) Transcript_7693:44-751(+)
MVLTRNQVLICSMSMNSTGSEQSDAFRPRKKLRKTSISGQNLGENNQQQHSVEYLVESRAETIETNQPLKSVVNGRLHAESDNACHNVVAIPDPPSAQVAESNNSNFGHGDESPFILARKLLRRRHVRKEQVKKERKVQMARKTYQRSKRKSENDSASNVSVKGNRDECKKQVAESGTLLCGSQNFTKTMHGTPCRSGSRKPSPLSEILMNMSEPMFSPVRSRTDIQHIRTVLFH